MEELRIEKFYNKPYHQTHRKEKLLNNKQKTILAYTTVGTILFIMGMLVNEIVKIFS